MHKEELLELHQMFYDIKTYYQTLNPALKFTEYRALNILPNDLNRSKLEHKYAIFILGAEIGAAMKEIETISSRGIPERMHMLADHTLKEIEAERSHS